MTTRLPRLIPFAGLALLLAATTARADFGNRFTAGHADLSIGYSSSGGLELFYELGGSAILNGAPVGGGGAEFSPSEIATIVPESVRTTVAGLPANQRPAHAGLPGPFASSPFYLLMQSSQGSATRPFLGFGAEEIGDGLFVGDSLTLTLTGFAAPTGGRFLAYANFGGSSPLMDTGDGLSAADAFTVFAGGHDHVNLGFLTAGIYDLAFTATGTLASTGQVVSTTQTFRFEVGNFAAVPEPASLATLALGGIAATGWARKRKPRRA